MFSQDFSGVFQIFLGLFFCVSLSLSFSGASRFLLEEFLVFLYGC